MLTIEAYDRHVDQLLDTVRRVAQALSRAGIPYRLIGGVAVFLHVHERDPLAARTTRDVDMAVDRAHLGSIIDAVGPFALDLCSGVRTNGQLDEAKLAAFFQAVQSTT